MKTIAVLNSLTMAVAFVGGVAILALFLGGCLHAGKIVEIAPSPAPVALTPAKNRFTDTALKIDLAFLDQLKQQIDRIEADSPARAEATVLLDGVQSEYLAGSRASWLDETVVRIRALIDEAAPASALTEAARL